jgi:hypothetical protein
VDCPIALRVDARKWLMAHLAPKKYGNKILNEHTGADGGPVLSSLTVNVAIPRFTAGNSHLQDRMDGRSGR